MDSCGAMIVGSYSRLALTPPNTTVPPGTASILMTKTVMIDAIGDSAFRREFPIEESRPRVEAFEVPWHKYSHQPTDAAWRSGGIGVIMFVHVVPAGFNSA